LRSVPLLAIPRGFVFFPVRFPDPCEFPVCPATSLSLFCCFVLRFFFFLKKPLRIHRHSLHAFDDFLGPSPVGVLLCLPSSVNFFCACLSFLFRHRGSFRCHCERFSEFFESSNSPSDNWCLFESPVVLPPWALTWRPPFFFPSFPTVLGGGGAPAFSRCVGVPVGGPFLPNSQLIPLFSLGRWRLIAGPCSFPGGLNYPFLFFFW